MSKIQNPEWRSRERPRRETFSVGAKYFLANPNLGAATPLTLRSRTSPPLPRSPSTNGPTAVFCLTPRA